MKRIAKIILGCLAGIAGVLVLALVGINLYLQSGRVQQRVRLATEQALGASIEVRHTFYTPWTGLLLSGISVQNPADPSANLLEASGFSIRFECLPLLKKRFVINEVRLDKPHFSLRQARGGEWAIPQPPPTSTSAAQVELSSSEPPPPREMAPPEPPEIGPPPYVVELRRFSIRNGSALFRDRKGVVVAQLDDIEIDGRVSANETVDGSLHIGEIGFCSNLFPRNLKANFHHSQGETAISELTADLAGGELMAEIHATVADPSGPAFHLTSRILDVSIPKLIEEARGAAAGSAGTLAGRVELRGNPADAATITGTGRFDLDSAKVEPLDFIRQIGVLLRIDELQMLDLQRASLDFEVRDERVWVDELVLKTHNLIITGKGPVGFDGRLDLDGRFLVNEKIQHQLRGLLSNDFAPSEDAAYRQVAFDITGRLSSPKTNLVEKLTGFRIGNFGGFLKGLFRPTREPEDSKQKPESRSKPRRPLPMEADRGDAASSKGKG